MNNKLSPEQKEIIKFAFEFVVPKTTKAMSIVMTELILNIKYFENWEIKRFIKELDYHIKYFETVKIEITNNPKDKYEYRNKINELTDIFNYLTQVLSERDESNQQYHSLYDNNNMEL